MLDEYDSIIARDPSKKYDVQFLHHVLQLKMAQLVDALKLVQQQGFDIEEAMIEDLGVF